MGRETEQGLQTIDLVTTYVSIGEMTVMLLTLSILLVHICKKLSYRFLVTFVSLMICTDIATICLAIGLYAEETSYHDRHTKFLAIEIGVATVIYNVASNCVHWTLATKYWIISREVPRLFEGG